MKELPVAPNAGVDSACRRCETVRPWTSDLSIQRVRRNCKTAKELGSVLQFVTHVYEHTGFVSKEPRRESVENIFCQIIWQTSVTTRDAIG